MTLTGTAILELAQQVLRCEPTEHWQQRRRMIEFERALLSCEGDDGQLLTDLTPLFPRLNLAYEAFETELELEFAKSVLREGVDVRRYLLCERFLTLVANEVRMAGLREGDRAVMIGSGPFPITAILLYQEFGIHVTALDRDAGAVKISRQVIKTLGLERGISVEQGTGESFVVPNVRGVIVALLAHPKKLILQNIFANYGCRTKVICRTSHGIRQALYRPTDPSAFSFFKQIAMGRAMGDQTISSILLERGEGD